MSSFLLGMFKNLTNNPLTLPFTLTLLNPTDARTAGRNENFMPAVHSHRENPRQRESDYYLHLFSYAHLNST